MGDNTGIEWTDATWNPVRGCTRVSEGCRNCYAKAVAARFSGPGQPYAGFADRARRGSKWTGRVDVIWPLIDLPLRWRRPRRIFVNSMSDLFHEAMDPEELATIYAVLIAAVHLRGHTFQVLTKRAARMRQVLHDPKFWNQVNAEATMMVMANTDPLNRRTDDARATHDENGPDAPPPGIWLGVSVENQAAADERVPELLATPAALRFLSCEPLLGPVRLRLLPHGSGWIDALGGRLHTGLAILRGQPRIDWVITGGESGPGARPCWTPDVRHMVQQCQIAGVPVFVKQLGSNVRDRNDCGIEGIEPHEWPDIDPACIEHDVNGYREDYQGAPIRIHLSHRKGGDPAEWPEDLRVQQFPESAEGGV